jgi:molybdopterin synthase sulfur carrier subunit
MEVTVRLFATLRQQAGWSTQRLTVADGATVEDVLQQLDGMLPGLNVASRTLYAAVNQGYAKRESVLAEGDEVAFFPPVSGGA